MVLAPPAAGPLGRLGRPAEHRGGPNGPARDREQREYAEHQRQFPSHVRTVPHAPPMPSPARCPRTNPRLRPVPGTLVRDGAITCTPVHVLALLRVKTQGFLGLLRLLGFGLVAQEGGRDRGGRVYRPGRLDGRKTAGTTELDTARG